MILPSFWRHSALRYGVVGVLILLMLVCLRAAWWQYQRAQEKIQVQEALTKARAAPTISWQQLTQDFKHQAARFYRLRLVGHWLPASKSIGLENYIWKKRHGVLWLVPFQPIHTDDVVMIALAWQPNAIEFSQARLPLKAFGVPSVPPSASSALVHVEGTVDLARFQRLSLGQDEVHSRSWLSFTPEKYEKRFGIRVSPYWVWAQKVLPEIKKRGEALISMKDNNRRGWQTIAPQPDFSPTMHWIYVGQWLIFSIFAAVCGVLIVLKK